MPQAFALHIGIQQYDSYYPESVNRLKYCINDMNAMKELSLAAGIPSDNIYTMKNEEAKQASVEYKLRGISKKMSKNDLFLFTFSGHGVQVSDEDGDEVNDRLDESICLYDGLMVDDMLLASFSNFPEDARIICLFDSCHSSSVIKKRTYSPCFDETARELSEEECNYLFAHDKENIQSMLDKAKQNKKTPKAVGISFSACDDNKKAYEKDGYGCFTKAIKDIFFNDWNRQGTYLEFFDKVYEKMKKNPNQQLPAKLRLPSSSNNRDFFQNETFLSIENNY